MDDKIKIQELSYNNRDKVTSVIKGAFGAIPIAGPIAQEILGAIIPHQRLDRIVKFIEMLDDSISKMKIEVTEIYSKINEPVYADFFYKACLNSADSITDDRISYIRNIFVRGIKEVDTEIVRYESLLILLGKLNDIELMYLYRYNLLKWDIVKYKELKNNSENMILYPIIRGDMSQEERDNENAKLIYSNNLLNLGLLEMEYNDKGKRKYKCSSIGDMLIRYIQDIDN